MVCIYCGSATKVSNSRPSLGGVWRRRQCLICATIFSTRENVDFAGSLRVKNIAGNLEPFSRDKLFISLYNSLSHRKTALEDAGGLCDTVVSNVVELQKDGVMKVQDLTYEGHKILLNFDKAAATYYQAHHLNK